jgi:hypothetical protein
VFNRHTTTRATTRRRSEGTRARTAVPALLAALGLTVVPLVTAAPAGAAAPRLTLEGPSLELRAPDQTQPLTDDCWRGWSGAPCGMGTVNFTLAGFDAFGGIPSCDPDDAAYTETCEEPVASLVETRGTRVDVVVRCAGKWLPRVASVPVVTQPSHLVGPPDVSAFNRLDSDRAKVSVLFYLPTPSQIGVCGGRATELLSATARNVTVGWTGVSGTVPAGTTRVPGVHRFHLS